jgi:hypothetical protein
MSKMNAADGSEKYRVNGFQFHGGLAFDNVFICLAVQSPLDPIE